MDRFGHPVSRQPCGEPISGVEQPGIAGFGGEQHQLTDGCSATFLLLSTTASTASSYTVTSAACRGPSRTAAEYRAHERAFGVELARNLRTARARIGFGRGPPLDCGGQLRRAGLEGGGFGSSVSRGVLASRLALAVPAISIAATNSVDRGWASAVRDRNGTRPQTGPHH